MEETLYLPKGKDDKSPRPSSSAAKNSLVVMYNKLVVPISMRSIYWKYFGFPANDDGEIISKSRIVCVICKTQIAYNKNTSNLRMHLQNKHMTDLVKIEAAATTRNCKSKVVRRPVKMVEGGDDSNVEYYLESASDGIYTEGTSSADPDIIMEDRKMSEPPDMIDAITNYAVMDLQTPDLIDGPGFQSLLLSIESTCSVPSKHMLVNDLIPKLYSVHKAKLMEELSSSTTEVGLTMEEWNSSENIRHLTICAIYPVAFVQLEWKVLRTITFLDEYSALQWELIFNSIFEEWGLSPERVTAIVCATERANIITALANAGYVLIPCLDFTIKKCVESCFDHEIIKKILQNIRNQIITVKNHPLLDLHEYVSSADLSNYKLVLDYQPVWLSTLSMLETAITWRETMSKLLEYAVGPSLPSHLFVSNDEWDIITDLVQVLQTFKISLMSLSEEKVPLVSLVRPMLWQVINNKLQEEEGDSVTAQNLKKSIVDIINYSFQDERVSSFLDIATVVDPRFKLLSTFTAAEKQKANESIMESLSKIMTDNPDDQKNVNKKKSNLELLLGSYNTPKREKIDSGDLAKNEYHQYLNHTTSPLESCPVLWWWRKRDKYQRLSQIADKYLCVPAVATLPGKRTLEQLVSFYTKRSSIPEELIEQYLFLHVNYSPT